MLFAMMMSVALHGVVVDTHGTPLPGVSVTLIQGTARTTVVTDRSGAFAFPNVAPASRYKLTAQISPYEVIRVRKSRESIRIVMAPITIVEPMPVLLINPVSGVRLMPGEWSKLPF
jgi:Carboxypeptidase regulatory-like domain